MSDTGVRHDLIDEIAALAPERDERPVFVVDAAGEIVFAGPSAARQIGEQGLDAQTRAMLARLASGRSSSMLRLRLGETGRFAPVSFMARPLSIADAPALLVLEATAPLTRLAEAEPVAVVAEPADDAAPAVAEAAAEAEGAEPLDEAAAAKAAQEIEAAAEPENIRFIFEIDAERRLSYLSPDLEKAVGESARLAVGRRWDELSETYDLDPSRKVSDALAGSGGWGEITIGWPTEAGRRIGFALSALPMFDRGRTLVGFRGLGRSVPAEGSQAPTIASQAGHDPVIAAPEAPMADAAEPEPQPAIETSATETPQDGQPQDIQPQEDLTQDEPARADLRAEASPEQDALALDPVVADDMAETAPAEALEPFIPAPEPEPVAADLPQPPASDLRPAWALAMRPEPPAIIQAPVTPDTFSGNVVPLRDMVPRLVGLSSSEESAFDEIARRLNGAPAADAAAEETTQQGAEAPPAASSAGPEDFARLLDRLPVGAIVLRAGAIDYANRAALDMLGHRDFASLATRGAEKLFAEPIDRSDAAPATMRLVSDDGVEIEAEARLSAIGWRGAPATLVSLRRAEGAVANAHAALEREREMSAMLDAAADGVITLDGAGRILSVNRGAEGLFGFEGRDVVGSLFTLSLAPESRKTAFDSLDRQRSTTGSATPRETFEALGLSRHGGAIPLSVTLGRIGQPASEIEGADRFCAVLRDITVWKRSEEELIAAKRQADRANAQKSDFLAKIGREVRTPLNAIIGFAEVMMEERFGPIGSPRYKDYLRDIHVSGGHLISLVSDLLDITRVESGAMKLDFAPVDLNEIAAQAAALLQPQASRDHVIIRTSLARALPPVLADRRSIRQIMTNLASNAVRFSRPGGQVIVATALTDVGQAVIRVRDAGAGMTKQELARAFEPFRPMADNDAGSAGLGLPLTKALAEANEAALALQSELGHGTLAEVTFPASRVLAV